jgi:hypothetical protein
MRDSISNIDVRRAISPVASAADNTPIVSQIIDRRGYDMLAFIIATGALPDVDATFTTLVEHGDTSNLSDVTAVDDIDLVGTEALASFVFSADDRVFKIGYRGLKRYVRLTITPGANTSASLLAAIALLGYGPSAPFANPPA